MTSKIRVNPLKWWLSGLAKRIQWWEKAELWAAMFTTDTAHQNNLYLTIWVRGPGNLNQCFTGMVKCVAGISTTMRMRSVSRCGSQWPSVSLYFQMDKINKEVCRWCGPDENAIKVRIYIYMTQYILVRYMTHWQSPGTHRMTKQSTANFLQP